MAVKEPVEKETAAKTTRRSATKKPAEKENGGSATKFTREQLLGARQFSNRRDALRAVVEHDETLTVAEATQRMNEFLKGKVN